MRTVTWLFALICLATVMVSPGVAVTPDEILAIRPFFGADKIPAGSEFKLAVEMKLLTDWHINSNAPTSEFAIPTVLAFDELTGITITRITYPPAKVEVMEKIDMTIDYYDGTSYIVIEGLAAPDISPGNYTLRGTLTYQGCKGRECLLPGKKEVLFPLKVAPEGTLVAELNPEIFAPGGIRPDSEAVTGDEVGTISQMVSEKGLLLTLVLIFLGGLALNLTPCVYPLIPITISYFGGLEQRGKRFVNAAAYVLGIALTYSVLGTVAALSGEMLGKQLTNPVVTVVIAGVLLALSLSMFGLYEIRVPSFIMRLVGGEARSGAAGSLVMGCTMGIIAAPCIGPFVVGLMTYVATLGDPLRGFLIFFVLALGMGAPYLVLGVFSSSIASLPRSGEWMLGVRRIFGFVLIIMAIYFLEPLIGGQAHRIILSAGLFISGFWLIVIDASGEKTRGFRAVKCTIAIVMIVAATWLFRPGSSPQQEIEWHPYTESIIEEARSNGLPVVIDFFADWCIPCKELDTITFRDPAVVSYSGKVVFVKADLTLDTSEFAGRLKDEYAIKGVPTVVFLSPDGREDPELRLTGFEGPDKFIVRMRRLTAEK